MKIRFVLETPTLLSKECTEELVEYAKQKVKELIAKYGVYEIYITAKPLGLRELLKLRKKKEVLWKKVLISGIGSRTN